MTSTETFRETAADDPDVLDDDESDADRADLGEDEPIATRQGGARELAHRWRTLVEGDVVARKYRITSALGRTGRIVTVGARHLELDQIVTLSYLAPEAAEEPGRAAQFLRKAKLAARVPSRHAAKVLDVGRLLIGSPYAVLEHLPGWTLAEVLRVRGPLPVPDAASYVAQAARAAAEAQAVGLRPVGVNMHNLVLTRESNGGAVVKAVLFGASNAEPDEILRTDVSLEDEAETLQLLPYVAPEHVRHSQRRDDTRADVWALGTVLYELLTGLPAFSASSTTGMLAAIVADPAPEIRRLRPDVPPELDAILSRSLAKDPAERFGSVDELALALEPFLGAPSVQVDSARSGRVSHPPPLPTLTPTARAIVASSRRVSEPPAKTRAVDRGTGLLAGLVLGIAGLAAVQAVRSGAGGSILDATPSAQVAGPQGVPQAPALSNAVPPTAVPPNAIPPNAAVTAAATAAPAGAVAPVIAPSQIVVPAAATPSPAVPLPTPTSLASPSAPAYPPAAAGGAQQTAFNPGQVSTAPNGVSAPVSPIAPRPQPVLIAMTPKAPPPRQTTAPSAKRTTTKAESGGDDPDLFDDPR